MTKRMAPSFWDGWSAEGVVSGVYTELRQPITTIKGYILLLLNANLNEQERHQAMVALKENILYVESVIDALHHYAKQIQK